MLVTGPDWPSTRELRAALADIPGPTIAWGNSGMTKLQQLQRLGAGGVSIPTITTHPSSAINWHQHGMTVFGRFATHTKGTDILTSDWLFANRTPHISDRRLVRWNQRDFYFLYIPSIAEYRAHVWAKKCFRLGRKLPQGPNQPHLVGNAPLIRSSLRGWQVVYGGLADNVTETRRTQLHQLAIQSCRALGYLFGAVDILEGEDGRLYVLEVNTAPALGANTLARYVETISAWATRYPRGETL